MLLTFLMNTFIIAKLNVLNNMWRMPGVKGSEMFFKTGAKMKNLYSNVKVFLLHHTLV